MIMKCIICQSPDVVEKEVEEEIRVNKNIVFIPVKVLVCRNCGEKYYSRREMKRLEKIESDIKKDKLSLKVVGKVLKASAIF